jgi:hypothetical protein
MEFQAPHYEEYVEDFQKIAKHYSLNPEKIKIEFYTPQCQAILTEQIEDHTFKIHINLEEDRIVSIKHLTANGNGNTDTFKEKYRKFMK